MNVPLDSVPYFDAITNSQTTGAVTDADSTPTFAVYENNTDTDMGVGGNMTKRTSLTGNYRCNFTCSAANGFELGKWYNVIASATVGSVSGKARIGNFRIVAAETVAGYIMADASKIAGQTITAAAGVTFPSSIASPTNITAASGVALSSAGVQAIWDALTSALTTVGSIGKFLIDRLDAAITSRMATFTYTTPPTAVAVRTEMDSNSTKLANLDATVSSRLATSGYTVPPTAVAIANEVEAQIIDETDSEKVLTAITDKIAAVNPDLGGLTVSAIASAVRTNLTTELGRIDAAVTSRMATFTYTAPPSAATVASATRTELTTELGRIDAAITSRLASGSYTAPPSAGTIAAAVNPVTLAASQPNYAPALVADLTTVQDALTTILGTITAKTDNLPSDPADASDISAVFTTIGSTLTSIGNAVTASAIRSAVGLAAANLDSQLDSLDTGALTYEELAQSILLRKVTFDSGSGQYIVWDQAGTAELGRLTPTTSAGALPIIGMVPA